MQAPYTLQPPPHPSSLSPCLVRHRGYAIGWLRRSSEDRDARPRGPPEIDVEQEEHDEEEEECHGREEVPHVVVVEVPEDDARAVEVHALLGGGTVVAHLDRVEVQGGAPRHRHHRRSPQSPLAHVLPVLQLVGHVGQGGHPHDGPLQVDNPVEEDGLDQRARDGGGEDESVDAADEGDEAPPALHQLAPRRPHQHVPAQHRLLAERQPSQVPPPALEAVLSIPLPVLLPHLLPPPQ
mmetsp:Transcript_33123/g.105574  ORF Transcript_33123/g.105574 Transcript_33123/m.105574 type:complete len:237 (+) Transcript_33123:129-839(+)